MHPDEKLKQVRADVARLTDSVQVYLTESVATSKLTGEAIERLCSMALHQLRRIEQLENETGQLRALNAMHVVALGGGTPDQMQQAFADARDAFARQRPETFSPVAWGEPADPNRPVPAAQRADWLSAIMLQPGGVARG